MKTHVLTFAKQFMNGHPKAGEPTDFRKKLQCGSKIHTIRSSYDYWAPKIQEVSEGKAFLSLREWTGKPYRSKQREFMRVFDAGFQRVDIIITGAIYVDGKRVSSGNLIENDGLTVSEFDAWFEENLLAGIIIHFTDFRY